MDAWGIIFSFTLTWSIGLGLPAVVRFLIFRRRLQASEAIGWSFGLAFVEFVVFVALGGQSKTHAVLLLIAVAAYRILVAGSGPWDREGNSSARSGDQLTQLAGENDANRAGSSKGDDDSQARRIEQAPIRPRLNGWIRLAIVAILAWCGAVTMRVAYEMSGDADRLFLVSKYRAPPEVTRADFEALESELLLELEAPAEVERRAKQINTFKKDKREISSPSDELLKRMIEERKARIDNALSPFPLEEPTEEELHTLSVELSVPVTNLVDKREATKKLLRLRSVIQATRVYPVTRAHVFKEPAPEYSVAVPVTAIVLLLPLFLFIFIWLTASWVLRGFKT